MPVLHRGSHGTPSGFFLSFTGGSPTFGRWQAHSRVRSLQDPPHGAALGLSVPLGRGAKRWTTHPDGVHSCTPHSRTHTAPRGCTECDVLWQASPVSIPADPVLWSGGPAPTSCLMSRTVHRCPCVSDTVGRRGTCSGCHGARVSAGTLSRLVQARACPGIGVGVESLFSGFLGTAGLCGPECRIGRWWRAC